MSHAEFIRSMVQTDRRALIFDHEFQLERERRREVYAVIAELPSVTTRSWPRQRSATSKA